MNGREKKERIELKNERPCTHKRTTERECVVWICVFEVVCMWGGGIEHLKWPVGMCAAVYYCYCECEWDCVVTVNVIGPSGDGNETISY